MNRSDFDVVIVGARCAGAALATFLARSGTRVLLLDRDSLHTDQVLSTHNIHPPGIDVLDRLGVGPGLRDRTPAIRKARLVKNDAWIDAEFEGDRAEYCPRRFRLDGLLQDAAAAAGAELADRTRVTEVLFREGRAVGVRVEGNGGPREIRAGLVVGADGRRSTVAEQVGAEEYLGYDAPRGMYWAYWDAPGDWQSDRYPFGMYLAQRGADYRIVFSTDDDQLLIGSLPPIPAAREWRKDPLGSLRRNLSSDPVTGPLVAEADPAGKVRGTVKERYFFRPGTGPGWVLVGDAGHHKDFVIGDGITEALIQAESLASAIEEGSDGSLIRWWRARDVEALPGYFWGQDEGAPGPPAQLQTLVWRYLARDPDGPRLLTKLPEHEATPYDLLPPSKVLPWILKGVARGRLGLIPEFIAFGRRAREFHRALRERKALLEAALA